MALVFMEGREAAEYAPMLWEHIPYRERKMIFWDSPMFAKRDGMAWALAKADKAAIYFNEAGPVGVAWIVPIGPHTRTGNAHFVLPLEREELDRAGREMDAYFGRYYDCLMGFIPVHFYGARAFVERMGFHEAARLPKACYIQLHNRCIDGCLYLWRAK